MGMCIHCGVRRATRPWGVIVPRFCIGCYREPAVRDEHRGVALQGVEEWHGVADRVGAAPAADVATLAVPGSAAKCGVMMGRAADGARLGHGDDAVDEGGLLEAELAFVREFRPDVAAAWARRLGFRAAA